jgi:hypothetical protein
VALIPDLPMQSVDADFGEGPVRVYWRRISLSDWDAIEQAEKRGNAAKAAEIVFVRARTEAGLRMFNGQGDREKIMHRFDSAEVIRVAVEMMKGDEAGN